jgi:hypothetical protein
MATSAQAEPVLYSVAFDGSEAGDPGTGSFLFDDTDGLMTNFTWDFGEGRTGGFTDAELAEILGSQFGDNITFGKGLFEMFVGEFTVPTFSRSFSRDLGLIGPFPTTAEFCWGTGNSACGMPNGMFPTYEFVNDGVFFRGEITIAEAAVAVDVRPRGCPNPINRKARGVLPVAILGTADFDVSEIDPTTVRLAGVPPAGFGFEDVATPVSAI